MMVVHEENDTHAKIAVIRQPAILESKKYVIVKNHVRELNVSNENESNTNFLQNSTHLENNVKKDKRKSKRHKQPSISCTESDNNSVAKAEYIDKSDLEELKIFYKKCKTIVKKIETKYGHLLNLKDDASISIQGNKNNETEMNNEFKVCTCTGSQKIIFDEDGNQSTKEQLLENHICPKRLKRKYSDECENPLQIEYEEVNTLPDDLQTLATILQNPDINVSYRNKVISKVKRIKLDYFNELKFNKISLKEKLTLDLEEVLDFKGTNLSTISGYPE